VGVQAQFPENTASSYCSVSVSVGSSNGTSANLVASQDLQSTTEGQWTYVGGYYQPKLSQGTTLYILASCDLEDPSYTGNVLIDAAVFESPAPCSSKALTETTRTGKRRGNM
jgi:hypothetical protein